MNKQQARIIAVLTIAAIVLGFLISRKLWFRLDLTDNKAYTISGVSKNLYTEIPDQVRITYYVSDRLVSLHPMPGQITDLLREYAAHSHGRIRLTVRDPAKANLVQTVEELGILGQQIETVEQDEASVAVVYSGILIEYLDNAEVLPVVFSLDTLEYDLTSRIRALIRGTEREAGVLVGSANRQWASDYGYLNQAFYQAGFKIRLINPGEEISDTLPVLIVLGGAEYLDEWSLYRIDRYIQGGGKVLFALEAVEVGTENGLEAQVITDQGLLSMVSFYGATVKPELVLDRSALTIPVQGRGGTIRLVRYPHFVSVLEQYGNPSHPISAGFGGVDLFWASPIDFTLPAGVEGTVLFTSTPEAWLMTRDFVIDTEAASYAFSREELDTRGTKVLAAALSGKFPAWFAGVPKPVREGSGEELPDLPREAQESRIVVIGDTDLGSGYIQYTRSQRNLDFLIQAADWLSNDDDIIGIRNRENQTGRLDRIVEPEKRLAAIGFSRILNVVILPLLVIIAGLLIALRRKQSFLKDK
ncbi:hypothetical protein FACS189483_06090 [Spirochaetia bacterium]|nr:hypothetical protein FACS189483_06090 [Spirochaetia bacterium]